MNERTRHAAIDSNRIDLEAAEWLVKRDRGFTRTEQDEFLQWLASDPRHGEWLSRHQQTWGEFNLLAQWRPEHSTEPNPDLLARSRPRRRRWTVPAGLAMAAGIALAFTLWPAKRINPSPASEQTAAISAESYERRSLEDGSTVELNRGAAVTVHFSAAERRIVLVRGEAHFTVEKNAARPFIVRARGVDVRAIGTVFNVRLESAAVEVLVTSGTVQVGKTAGPTVSSNGEIDRRRTHDQPAAGIPTLAAGQRAIVSFESSVPPQVATVSAEEIARALAWQPQLLDFTSTPLAQVIQEFNRRNRVQLVLAASELEPLPIVASVRSDNLEGFVRMLRDAAGVRAEYRGNDQIVLHPRR